MAYGFHHVDNLIALTMAPIRRTRHAPTTTRNLTHENSRSLRYYEYTLYRASVTVMPEGLSLEVCNWP